MNIKINILRAILIILLISMFSTIFGFSGQNGEKSGSLSMKITENITKNIEAIQKLEKSEKEQVLKKIEHFIRKLAHFSLYTVIGILAMSLMSTYKLKQKYRVGTSFAIGAIYACSDEFHQKFISGRTASLSDIGIDSCGVIFGIVLTYFIILLIKNKGIKNGKRENT